MKSIRTPCEKPVYMYYGNPKVIMGIPFPQGNKVKHGHYYGVQNKNT